MKRNLLFMTMLASLFLAGCSQEEITPNSEDNGSGEATTSYLAVNLVSSDVMGTRATGGDYVDGTTTENAVSSVRFYFFNGNGGTANVKVKGTGYVNYYDWVPGSNVEGNQPGDVEKKLKATIVISTKDGDKLPEMVVAVLNPPLDTDNKVKWGDDSKSLTQLQAVVDDYAVAALTRENKFVMFNSVYYNTTNGTEVIAVPITTNNLKKEESEALKNPVTIYVERSVAKVKVNLDSGIGFDTNNRLALKNKTKDDSGKDVETPITVGGEQVYLQLNGWGLTADTNQGRLVKKINPSWTTQWWRGTHRTFWAINDMNAENRYHTYNNLTASLSDALYTNENAGKNDIDGTIADQANTKVIIKGTLCKDDGTPFTIVRHLGALFPDVYSTTESSNLPALKDNILSQLSTNDLYYYYEETTGEGENAKKERKQIGAADLKIVVALQDPKEESDNNCYVYAQLTDAAQSKIWYNTLDEGTIENPVQPIQYSEINTSLSEKVDKALVWQSGMTYYYYEIKHLHNDQNQLMTGVVRNHVYETTVTKILGLGTPVYDPTKTIYPEKPSKNDHYIAAEINILSWRLVQNSYELEW